MAIGQTRAERQLARTERRTARATGGKRRKKSKGDLRREQKNARKALYKSMAEHGDNSKAKGASARNTIHRARGSHPQGDCGNIACSRCSPAIVRLTRESPRSCDVRRTAWWQ